jgi:hypothetical protein
MKKFKVLSSGLMCLSLFAQEPQGRGGQLGPPGGDGAGARGGGQRGGGPPGGGPPRGGGAGPKNVHVLNPTTLPETMQSFVQALGLLDKGTCNYPCRGQVFRRKETEGGCPQDGHHDARN